MANHSRFIFKIIITFLICFVLIQLIPSVAIPNADSILTAATFLFSVLYGFEISVVIGNFSQLKTQIAIQNASLLSVYHLAGIIGGETETQIKTAVENYLLRIIDLPLEQHLLGASKEFFAIFEPLKTVPDGDGQERGQAIQYMNEGLYYMPQSRNQIADVAPKFVDAPVWLMLFVLAAILVGVLFINAGAGFLSIFAATIFATTVVGSLFLLDEIDSNRIQEAHLEYDVFNETLLALGLLPYYPDFALKSGIIKARRGEKYRLGTFPKYPSLDERVVQTVV
jgi:hypothetical protein